MSREDRLKEELSTLRLLLGVFTGGGVSALGWILQSYSEAQMPLLIVAFVFVALLGVACWRCYSTMCRISEKLEMY